MAKENKMGVMPVPRLVITMSFPIMVSMLVQSLYNIVDSIFVARISEEALTATSIAYSAQMLQIAVAVGTGVGANALISRCLGAKQFDRANEAATTGLLLTVLSSLIFVLWGIFGTEVFVRRFSSGETITALGTSYLHICQVYSTGLFLGTFFQRLLQATGRTFSSMLAQITGAVVNIVLDPIMIFGLFGCPEMGITGAAIATVTGQWAAAAIGLILNIVQNKEIHFVFRNLRFRRESVLAIYRVGAPTIITQACGSLMMAAMNAILIMFSSTAVAFFGVYFKLQSFLFMPMNGLGQGSLPIVGYNFGAGNSGRVRETCRTSLTIGVGIAVVGMIVFMAFPEKLLHLFAASDAMIRMGVPALRIICVSCIPASVTMIIGYVISGLGNGLVNMTGTAIRQLIVLVPFVYLFGRLGGLDLIWFAFWISELTAVIFAVICLKKAFQKLRQSA
ncbi:MAG: MATE family efflux transporter [Lachnospiraceae bacterium]|nr:MATE family efflux transporter [Lachnospiraceae bacterium]MDY4970428.1 MATE family efflux transporter [Lachnospiraceae bacterium]